MIKKGNISLYLQGISSISSANPSKIVPKYNNFST